MVNVGIIGLGPVWEPRYRPAIARLRDRMSVCAVFDFVHERAAQVAAGYGAADFDGILALAELGGADAFLVLDTGWAGEAVLRLVCRARKPMYVSGSFGSDLERLRSLEAATLGEGLTLMPEFSRRYTPATGRLQELIAARIGRPRKIIVEAHPPDPRDPQLVPGQGPGVDFLTGLFDWCRYIARTPAVRLQAEPLAETTNPSPDEPHRQPANEVGDRRIRIEYARRRAGGEACLAELVIRNRKRNNPSGGDGDGENSSQQRSGHSVHGTRHPVLGTRPAPRTEAETPSSAGEDSSAARRVPFTAHILCERGEAELSGPAEIQWRDGGAPQRESLVAERPEVEVMLDQFCRRAVGGLVPVADMTDVLRGVELAHAVEQALRTGREATFDGSHGR